MEATKRHGAFFKGRAAIAEDSATWLGWDADGGMVKGFRLFDVEVERGKGQFEGVLKKWGGVGEVNNHDVTSWDCADNLLEGRKHHLVSAGAVHQQLEANYSDLANNNGELLRFSPAAFYTDRINSVLAGSRFSRAMFCA